MYLVKNVTNDMVSVGGLVLLPGESKTVDVLNAALQASVLVSITPTVVSSLVALTDNSTGTSGGNTIGAVNDVATAANAVATLAAKMNQVVGFVESRI